MIKDTSKLTLAIFILFSVNVFAAQITVQGIEGLTFNKSESNYTLTLTDNFTLHGMQIEPQSLSLSWDQPAEKFTIYGALTLTVDGDEFDVELGSSGNPGLIITNDELQSVNIDLTADFSVKDLQFNPEDILFIWNKSTNKYEISGTVKASIEDDEIDATFGDEATPGFIIHEGAIEQLIISVTAEFSLKNISFQPEDLTFLWHKASDKYLMYGEITVKIEDDEIDATFGDESTPGITISNGTLENLDISVTSEFSLKTISFQPEDLTFLWQRASDKYLMYGDVTVKIEEDEIDATFGDETTPGIVIEDGIVNELNISISSDFELKTLSFHAHDATFYWDRSENKYFLYGSFTIDVESDEVEVILGTEEHPGVVIENGLLTTLHMDINADFEMKGMSIIAHDVGIEWFRESSGDFFGFYGDIKVNIDEQDIDANFGDKHHPGLIYKAGSVTKIFLSVTSDFRIGNLEVETDELLLRYENDIYHLTGTMTITDIWTLNVDLGAGSNSGIEIDVSGSKDKFVLESLVITLDNANLGTIDFKKIQLTFEDNKLEEADMIASFPPGWEVEGKIQFTTGDRAEISGATIVWETFNLDEAIEIPGTGMDIIYISGNLYELNDASKTHFDGTVGLTFGGPFEVDGYDLAFFYISSNIGITQRALYIDTDIDVGAYRHDSKWKSMLGYGSLNIGLIWNDEYTIDGKFKIPTDPMIEAKLKAKISENNSVDALLDVEFIVPHFVPYIHGKHFGSVDGAFRYLDGHPTKSYAAGWIKWDLWLTDIYVGAKYNIGTKKASKIGHSSIDHIKDEVKDDLKKTNGSLKKQSTNQYSQLIKSFIIEPKAPTMVRVGLNWVTPIDTSYVTVIGPAGIVNLASLLLVDDGDSNSIPTMSSSENLTFSDSDTEVDFLIVPTSSLTNDKETKKASLAPGKYQVFFSYNSSNGIIDSLNIEAEKHHPLAHGEIAAIQSTNGSINLNLDYWAYHPDSTLISIFVNDTSSYSGSLVEHITYENISEDGSGESNYNYFPKNLNDNSSVYFYFVIDDGINTPFYSDFTKPVVYTPPIYGNITLLDQGIVADSISQSFMVYIDDNGDSKYDTQSTGEQEASCVTNDLGAYEFHDLIEDNYPINIVLPKGYVLDDTSPNQLPYNVNYSGKPVKVDFTIRKEN